jgi:hypothetical protein
MSRANRLPEIEMLRLPQVDLPLEGKLLVVYESMNPAAPEDESRAQFQETKSGFKNDCKNREGTK